MDFQDARSRLNPTGRRAVCWGARLPKGLSEGEIRQGIAEGGRIRNVLVVCTVGPPDTREHLAYIRPSWRRDFLPMRTWGDKANRTYKDVDRLLALLRDDFGYQGVIPFYVADDPDLPKYRALAASAREDDPALLKLLEHAPKAPQAD
ncbi:hypothetical protein ROTAS13_03466 [Roseomonas sp. TAS13]|nr:hypothetical protein ROTAS13_03466 [Roseomonas sp. TAS13]